MTKWAVLALGLWACGGGGRADAGDAAADAAPVDGQRVDAAAVDAAAPDAALDAAPDAAVPAHLTLSPSSHDYGDLCEGTPPCVPVADAVFQVSNTGGSASGPPSVMIDNSTSFAVAASTCTAPLAPGAACAVTLRFLHVMAGPQVTRLTVSATPGGSVTAAGAASGLICDSESLTPSGQHFGGLAVGARSPSASFTIQNFGDVTLGPFATQLFGTDPGEFAITADSCQGASLSVGSSCTVDVAFAPTSSGPKRTVLGLTASCGHSASAELDGTGL